MEVQMTKFVLAVVLTAIPAFAAGMWTQGTLAQHHAAETIPANNLSTISPSDMHRKVKPNDLPIQYMQGDFN
jgi:hypothetical protein